MASSEKAEQIDPTSLPALVVADHGDEGVEALLLRSTAADSLVPVRPAQLALAAWNHRVLPDGNVHTTMRLRDGRILDDRRLGRVLVRADVLPARRLVRPDTPLCDFAGLELQATLVTWLRGLGDRLVNRLHGTGATGPTWSRPRWLVEAAKVGLPVDWASVDPVTDDDARSAPRMRGGPGWRPAARADLVLVNGTAVGPAPPGLAGGLRRLAVSAGCGVLGIELTGPATAPIVAGADPVPPLTGPGQAEAVAALLAHPVAQE